MRPRFSAAMLVLLKLALSESLRCVRCNSYIDVENSHCWNPTHDLLVTCPDRLDGTTPMCLSELRIMKTQEELELVDLKKDCYYGFKSDVSILRQDICRENFCNTFALPEDPELLMTAKLTSESGAYDEFGRLSCISCAGKESCLTPTLRMRTSATELCEPYYGWPGCFLESWMNEKGELDSIRRGCYDFSQKPGQFTEFIYSSKCTENKCNFDQFDFRAKFSENAEMSGDDSYDDEKDKEKEFFSTTEKEIDDLVTNVVTIGTESYETTSGDYDYASGSGDGAEYESIYIPEIISVAELWTKRPEISSLTKTQEKEIIEPEVVDPKKNIKGEKGPIPKPQPTEEITVFIGYGEPISEEIIQEESSALLIQISFISFLLIFMVF